MIFPGLIPAEDGKREDRSPVLRCASRACEFFLELLSSR